MKFTLLLLALVISVPALATDPAPTPTARPNPKAERMNVDALKQKYWATGEEADLQVVQNRKYSKANKFEVGIYAGTISSDPFLTTKNLGGRLGFNITEYIAVSALLWKSFPKNSSATEQLERDTIFNGRAVTANTNPTKSYMGGEFNFIPIYGKLSLLGKLIIYYDLKLSGGLGMTKTETGNYFTPSFGIGQKIYITNNIALALDYRYMRYSETVMNKTFGGVAGTRTNSTDVITLGVDYLIGFW